MSGRFRIVFLSLALLFASGVLVTSAPAKTAAKKPAKVKTAVAPAKAPAGPTAREILEKLAANIKSLQSYKFTTFLEGYDTFTKDRQKNMIGDYKSLAEKVGNPEVKVYEKPVLKRGTYDVKFMKPYLSQMKIVRSDFVPSIIYGTLITYRSDKDPEAWWAKLRILPIAIKRNVTKDDAGGAITSNWDNILLYMLFYSDIADISLAPEAEFDGRKCYVLRYTFDWKKRPVWNHKEPPFGDFEVPDQIKNLLWPEMLKTERQKYSSIDYFIDKERMIPLMSEEYINNGEFYWRTMYKDIQLGGLKESDF